MSIWVCVADSHVLRRALDFEVDVNWKKLRGKQHQKAGRGRMHKGLWTRRIFGINQIEVIPAPSYDGILPD